jgi:hypothetical protein
LKIIFRILWQTNVHPESCVNIDTKVDYV